MECIRSLNYIVAIENLAGIFCLRTSRRDIASVCNDRNLMVCSGFFHFHLLFIELIDVNLNTVAVVVLEGIGSLKRCVRNKCEHIKLFRIPHHLSSRLLGFILIYHSHSKIFHRSTLTVPREIDFYSGIPNIIDLAVNHGCTIYCSCCLCFLDSLGGGFCLSSNNAHRKKNSEHENCRANNKNTS